MKILFGVAAIPITSSDDLKNLPKKIYVIEGAFSGGSSKDNLSSESPPLRRIQVNTSSLV
jgi:hypothetical protein